MFVSRAKRGPFRTSGEPKQFFMFLMLERNRPFSILIVKIIILCFKILFYKKKIRVIIFEIFIYFHFQKRTLLTISGRGLVSNIHMCFRPFE